MTSPRPRESAHQVVATLEQIPGHPGTAAEVWVWQGHVPGVTDADPAADADAREVRVVLRADDWPMSSTTARRLAIALLEAAEAAERAEDAGALAAATPAREPVHRQAPSFGGTAVRISGGSAGSAPGTAAGRR